MTAVPTRGPWQYREGIVWGAHGRVVAFISRSSTPEVGRQIDQADANGRAVAALPDLIAALQDIAGLDAAGGAHPGDRAFAVNRAKAALKLLLEPIRE